MGMGYINGDRVLLSRRDLGINQEELARRVQVDQSYISQIERNKDVNVGVKVVFSLADALGVSAAYLLGLSDDPLGIVDELQSDRVLKESGAVYEAMSTTERRIVELLPSLSDADRFLILQTVERLTGPATPHIIGTDE